MSISIDTFRVAFEGYNDPEDFSEYLNKAFSKSSITQQLLNPNSEFFFVSDQDVLVAYIKVNLKDAQTESFDKDAMELERIYVLPEFIGLGYGKLIMNKLKEMACSKKISFLWLGVWDKNEAAIRFYQRHGFQKFDEHSFYLGKDKQTDWLMKYEFQ
jgi:ribosomal protein S18 acetylase RimI-like enzyme